MFIVNLFNSKKVSQQDKSKEKSSNHKDRDALCQSDNSKESSVNSDLALAYLCPNSQTSRLSVKRELVKIKNAYDSPYIDKDVLEKILDVIDYNKAQEHINNLKLLSKLNYPDYYLNEFIDNGYISSDKGLKAFDNAKRYFSTAEKGRVLSQFCIAVSELSVDNWDVIEKRDIAHLRPQAKISDFKELAELSDEEYTRTVNHKLFKEKLNYVSDNEDINKVFQKFNSLKELKLEKYKTIEQMIKLACDNDESKISELAGSLSNNYSNTKLVDALIKKLEDKSLSAEEFKFYAEHIPAFYKLVHEKIKDFDDKAFAIYFERLACEITAQNYKAVENVLDLGISQFYLSKFLNMATDEETIKRLDDITNKIKKGELPREYMIPYKSAVINDDIKEASEEYKSFNTVMDLKAVSNLTDKGEVAFVGEETYINHKGKMEKLEISKETFKELFPSEKSFLSGRQHMKISDCYFISGGIYSFNNNKDTRYYLLKLLKEDGDDILVSFPGFKNQVVRFKGGKLSPDKPHIRACKGLQILEEAYLTAKSKSTKNDNVYSEGGEEYIVFREILPKIKSNKYIFNDFFAKRGDHVYSGDYLEKLLDIYSNRNDALLCACTKAREEGDLDEFGISERHAYAIKNIDSKNKQITLVNPANTMYTTTISYEQFKKYFAIVSIGELND